MLRRLFLCSMGRVKQILIFRSVDDAKMWAADFHSRLIYGYIRL